MSILRHGKGTATYLAALVAALMLEPGSPRAAEAPLEPAAAPPPQAGTTAEGRTRAVVDGHRLQPRREDICRRLPRSPECRAANATAADDDLLREILRRSKP